MCRGSLHGPNCSFDHGYSQLQYMMAECPCSVGHAGSLPRRGAEAISHGQACLADHRDFAVAARAGWSMFLLCVSSKSRETCSGCVGRALCTGTGPGLTPAIRAGKGWRGRRELAPRCSATQLGACIVMVYRQRSSIYTLVRTSTTTTTTTPTTRRLFCSRVTDSFRCPARWTWQSMDVDWAGEAPQGSPAPGMAPSREDDGCHGAGDGPSPTVQSPRGLWWEGRERRQGTRRTPACGHRRPCLRWSARHLCLRWRGRSGAAAPYGAPNGNPPS